MVKRAAILAFASLMWGCPDDIAGGTNGVVTGLRAPTQLSAVPNGGSEVVLTWKDHATVETGYRVEMNPQPFGGPVVGGVEFLPANTTSFVFPVFPHSTYYFRVFALTSIMESEPSNVATTTTPNVPARPTGVRAAPASSSRIVVGWLDVSGESQYEVEWSLDGGASWQVGPTTPADAVSASVDGLSEGTEYCFRVVAVGSLGRSTPSRSVRASTLSTNLTLAAESRVGTGMFSSIVVTAAGTEHLSHYDDAKGDVLYTTRTGAGPFVTVIADKGPTGTQDVGADGTTIVVDSGGKAHIAAHNVTDNALRCATNTSGVWAASTVQAGVGLRPRILLDPMTQQLDLYYGGAVSGSQIEIIHARKSPEGSWMAPDGEIPVNLDPLTAFAVGLDPAHRPQIVMISWVGDVFHVHQQASGPMPITAIPQPVGSMPTGGTALAVDASGTAHVGWHDAASGGLYYSTNLSGSWSTVPLDVVEGMTLGRFCAMAIHRPTGRLHVAYYDETNKDLKYARKDPGSVWSRKVLDLTGDVGSHPSIAVDDSGAVHIAYRDETNKRLKVATGTP